MAKRKSSGGSVRSILLIAKKEFKGFVTSPIYYVILFFIAAILSYLFPLQLTVFSNMLASYVMQPTMTIQQVNIHYAVFLRMLSQLNLLLIFVVPALTMKMIAEEKKLRSFDLLLTSPVRSYEIVLGKYLGSMGAVAGIMLLGFAYPISARILASFSWGPLLIAFGGVFLLAAVYGAMGMFCSSLTETSLLAFIMSVVLNIGIWFLGMSVEVIDDQALRNVFEHVSLNTHLATLVEGTIRTGGIIFLVSVIGFFLFVCERMVESNRWRA